ncbi:MAG: dTDP-4-dehydrorhamnose 3,5-epimerase family protein [Proteobacteria bacterium]|nr:dTDP-4-dehydrorhamnose 3,5-epimerase family protein [Pseudomonadota bacterium]MDA0891151.1 dTDP-4-dehydrorhamnose 3,5-epimerase family protein [Pseudomonadota bacterium]
MTGAVLDITETDISGVVVVNRQRHRDRRGSFSRLFCSEELRGVTGFGAVTQINHSHTELAGTVRGIHLQLDHGAEAKLVNVIRGRIWDVAVDLRAGSPTFLRWIAVELDGESGTSLLIPKGCAHGFQTLEDGVDMIYVHDNLYSPELEHGFNPFDPRLQIDWPLAVTTISDRDKALPAVSVDYEGLNI